MIRSASPVTAVDRNYSTGFLDPSPSTAPKRDALKESGRAVG